MANTPHSSIKIDDIDALLPQTQCSECGYDGCRPYAQAIVNQNEALNRCPPGGLETAQALAAKLNRPVDTSNLVPRQPSVVSINETTCIGCTKCIQACPVDAIIGAAKQMHTVIADDCTGCGLCLPPCPVDCIQVIPLSEANYDKVSLANTT